MRDESIRMQGQEDHLLPGGFGSQFLETAARMHMELDSTTRFQRDNSTHCTISSGNILERGIQPGNAAKTLRPRECRCMENHAIGRVCAQQDLNLRPTD